MSRRPQFEPRLSRVALLEGVDPAALRRIDDLATVLRVRSGRVLMDQGAYGKEFAMVLAGSVEVTIDGELVSTLGPGEIVGEVAMVVDVPRTATVRTTSEAELAVIARQEFEQVLREAPVATRRLLRTVTTRLLAVAEAGSAGDGSDSGGCRSPGR